MFELYRYKIITATLTNSEVVKKKENDYILIFGPRNNVAVEESFFKYKRLNSIVHETNQSIPHPHGALN